MCIRDSTIHISRARSRAKGRPASRPERSWYETAMPSIETIDVRTSTRSEMIDITALVRAAVRKSGVPAGLACIFCPHTTAAVTIQENSDPAVKADMVRHLGLVVPREAGSDRPDQ